MPLPASARPSGARRRSADTTRRCRRRSCALRQGDSPSPAAGCSLADRSPDALHDVLERIAGPEAMRTNSHTGGLESGSSSVGGHEALRRRASSRREPSREDVRVDRPSPQRDRCCGCRVRQRLLRTRSEQSSGATTPGRCCSTTIPGGTTGVIVLAPEPDGFVDFRTLPSPGDYVSDSTPPNCETSTVRRTRSRDRHQRLRPIVRRWDRHLRPASLERRRLCAQ